MLEAYREAVRGVPLVRRTGCVRRLSGLRIEVQGLKAQVGELCAIRPAAGPLGGAEDERLAEVVGVQDGQLILMPFGSIQGLSAGDAVQSRGSFADRS